MMNRNRLTSWFIGNATLSLMWSIMGHGTVRAQQQEPPPLNTVSIPRVQQPNAVPSINTSVNQAGGALEIPSLKLRSQPGYVQVTVTVTDSSGNYFTDLKQDDFRVIDGGQQRPIEWFRVDRSAPVSIGVILDCSRSMEAKFPQARRAIGSMIDYLDPRDEIFLEAFSSRAGLVQPFTLDHARIKERLS